MTDAPEFIWAWKQSSSLLKHWASHDGGKDTTKYVRHDLVREVMKAVLDAAARLFDLDAEALRNEDNEFCKLAERDAKRIRALDPDAIMQSLNQGTES